MTQKTFTFDIVSAEKALFSNEALMLVAQTQVGEIGILPGHTKLLGALEPGDLRVQLANGEEHIFYVSGGILEVQPCHVTVLSDTIVRAEDLDEATILQAKQRAESMMAVKSSEVAYAEALKELAQAVAQLQALNKLKKKVR